jgi:hypothetical protein
LCVLGHDVEDDAGDEEPEDVDAVGVCGCVGVCVCEWVGGCEWEGGRERREEEGVCVKEWESGEKKQRRGGRGKIQQKHTHTHVITNKCVCVFVCILTIQRYKT